MMNKICDTIMFGSIVSVGIGGMIGISQNIYCKKFEDRVFIRTVVMLAYSVAGVGIFITTPIWITPMVYELMYKKFK